MGCGTCIDAGELRHRVTASRESLADDGAGGQTVTLTQVFVAWAKVRDRSGRERVFQDQLRAEAATEFIFRYSAASALRPDDRLTLDGVVYNVRHIDDLDRRRQWLVVLAERGATP